MLGINFIILFTRNVKCVIAPDVAIAIYTRNSRGFYKCDRIQQGKTFRRKLFSPYKMLSIDIKINRWRKATLRRLKNGPTSVHVFFPLTTATRPSLGCPLIN